MISIEPAFARKTVAKLEYAAPTQRRSWARWLGAVLVIVVVIATIGWLLLPSVSSYRPQTRRDDRYSKIAELVTGLSNFYQDYHRYPTDGEGLQFLLSCQGAPYVNPPLCDEWGHPFIYRSYATPSGPQFMLLSRGADGILGTEDDIRYPPLDSAAPSNTPATQPTPAAATALPSPATP